MKRILTSALLILLVHSWAFSQWQVSGGSYAPYTYLPAASTGLETVYVLYGAENLSLTFLSDSDAPMTCYRFRQMASSADPVRSEQSGTGLQLIAPEAGYGYYIEQEGRNRSFIWVIDYLPAALRMNSLSADSELSGCEESRVVFDREMGDLSYVTINGRAEKIEREFKLTYQTLSWNGEDLQFETREVEETVRGNREISVEAPLQNTSFTIEGDQFLRFWGIPQQLTSQEYEAIAVRGVALAEQTVRENGNELDKEGGSLGGSAPVEVLFTGYANTPVCTYQAWEISRHPEFEVIEATYPESQLEYTFENGGTTYVRFVISNSLNSCEQVVETFTINVSESSLQVPNVFTPDSESGDNRLFKVAYRSIIKFEGWVFNRWGNELFHWTDPAEGWDGTYHGKPVPTGAYYYVIKAEGVGGEKLNRKGDINILRTRNTK